MPKYIILILNVHSLLYCMEQTKVLDYTCISNILFPKPQLNAYNLITVYNPYILNKKDIHSHLATIHEYLTSSGELHGLVRTQTNNISLPEEAFLNVYFKIYETNLYKPKQTITFNDIPSVAHLKAKYFTDDELKEIIWSNGYTIVSCENKIYENIITNKSAYKEEIKNAFIHAVRNFELSKNEKELLSKELIKHIIQQSKKNHFNQIIESWEFTEIKLSKIENLRPPIFINDSLLSEKL